MDFDEDDLFAKLATLSKREREVLRLRCQRKKYIVIARELKPPIKEKSVGAHMHNICVKLGLDKIKDDEEKGRLLFEVICPALNKPLPPPEPEIETDPPRLLPASPDLMAMVIRDDDLILWQPKAVAPVPVWPKPVVIENKKQKKLPIWILLLLGMVLGTLLMAGIVWGSMYLAEILNRSLPTPVAQATPTPVKVISEVTVIVTQPPPPSEVIVVTATLLPASATLRPTNTSPVPTDTPDELTGTAQSSTTLTPGGAISFKDDFEDGLDTSWRVLSGDFIVTQGRLGTVSESMTVEIGDKSWSNYTVDLDYKEQCRIYFIVAQQIRYDLCEGDWDAFLNNQWKEIANGSSPSTDGHLRLIVSGSAYAIFINGAKFFDIKYGQPLSGPFAISVARSYSFVDNVVITSP